MSSNHPRGHEESTHSKPRCSSCGEHVSHRFARVFGDNRNNVRHCPACSTNQEIRQAADADAKSP